MLLFAGLFVDVLGSVKILKALLMSFLQVSDGSKRILSFRALAISFRLFRRPVRERLPWPLLGERGLSLGVIRSSLFCASLAHACGLRHPFVLSSQQALQ